VEVGRYEERRRRADRKWYRNWVVSRILVKTLGRMDPRYPQPMEDLPASIE
jgi:hypothetical protein